MELTQVENQRSGLIQFLVVLIMLFQGTILFVSYRQIDTNAVPVLSILALVACLYVVGRERHLRRRHEELAREVRHRDRHVDFLDRKLQVERGGSVELERQLKDVLELYRALITVNTLDDPRHTFQTVLGAALELVGGDCGSIMLLDTEEDELYFASSQGLGTDAEGHRLRVGEAVAGFVVKNGEPVIIDGNADDDARFDNTVDRQRALHIGMSVPLRLRGQVCGVLNLGASRESGKLKFSPEDVRNAAIFAQHAAVTIENAELHRERQRAAIA